MLSDSSSGSPLPEPYYIRVIRRSEKCEVLNFLREFFYEEEPVNSYLQSIQPENVRYIDRGVCATACIEEELSLMAISYSGVIAGMILIETLKPKEDRLPGHLLEKNPIYPIVNRLLTKVHQKIDLCTEDRDIAEKEINLKIICTHPEWRNKGVGQALLKRTVWNATHYGYGQIRSICTSAYSAKLLENFGFQSVVALKYGDYRVNGEVVLRPVEPHVQVRGLVLRTDDVAHEMDA